jgi:uncharacterized protein YwbE
MTEFSLVDPTQGREAYQWHRGFAAGNDCIFPRTWDQYEQLAAAGQLWCARNDRGDYLGLAYFRLDEGKWEVGGLMVATQQRGNGLGSTFMRLTLGHLLFEEDPLDRHESVIAHVHAENDLPRPIIENSLKFRFSKRIKVAGTILPGLRTNADGDVEGDEFELVRPDTLVALADWCDQRNGKLKNGVDAKVLLRSETSLHMWAEAFRNMAIR